MGGRTMSKTITITYDENYKVASVVYTDGFEPVFSQFQWDDDFKIESEHDDTDNEDYNDNARWLLKTLLCIMKFEKENPDAHCDWSADIDRNIAQGKYKFNVSIKKEEEC